MKKTLALLLALMMLLSVAAACAETAPKVNKFGWEIPDETIKFSVYIGSDNPDTLAKHTPAMHDYLLENFNVDITLITYENDATERESMMRAGNEYPDVVLTSIANAVPWIEQGRAADLTDYVTAEKTPNLVKCYGQYLQRLYNDEGRLYTLARSWGMSKWADYAPQVRYD